MENHRSVLKYVGTYQSCFDMQNFKTDIKIISPHTILMRYIKIGLRWVANVVWKIAGGVVFSLLWCVLGTILSISIIGLPLGIKCFKIAHFVWKPFGKEVTIGFGDNVILASIWSVTFGVVALILGLIWMMSLTISIVGIPLVYQMYKVIKVSVFPFGARIV